MKRKKVLRGSEQSAIRIGPFVGSIFEHAFQGDYLILGRDDTGVTSFSRTGRSSPRLQGSRAVLCRKVSR